MRRLRGFSKRRFGTAPTILGTHSSRHFIGDLPNTLSRVAELNYTLNEETESNGINVFAIGEVIAFRGTDGYPFNVIQLSRSYKLDNLHPNTKIVGNFLTLVEDNDDNEQMVFEKDAVWEGGSQPFRDVIRDNVGNIVTIEMQITTENDQVMYKLPKDVFEDISSISLEFENHLSEPNNECESLEDDGEEDEQSDSDENSGDEEPQQKFLVTRQRRNKGNRYASVMASLMV